MFVDVLGEYLGNVLVLLSPFEDGTIEVVFIEVTGEYIEMLILFEVRWHDAIQDQPVVEYQDGLFRFQRKATMKDVGQRHCCIISQSMSSLMTFGAALPASTNIFLPLR